MNPGLFDRFRARPVPNRRQRRAHLQRSSNCKASTPGSRVQAIPLGRNYITKTAGRKTLHCQGIKYIRHTRS